DEMQDRFYGSVEELAPAMDLSVDDERGELGDVNISDVRIDGDRVHISYGYEWTAYYGCSDMNVYQEEEGYFSGRLVDGFWVFEKHVPVASRMIA
ncbi:MAG: hypothetical protein U1E02_21070, partial [Hydrogenophaga sp.]|nr:hypothetical protein [Hydrogenophaga sp.]